jgi:DNA adenine methylase
MSKEIKSLFPYFGSKKRVAKDVWSRFGEIENFVEPFAGSLAILLGNPSITKIETINDKDTMVSNFWRAAQAEPDKVAEYADYPVLETDLHARHRWLISSAADELKHKINHDPFFYDTQIAGWWVWGMCASLGITFCKQRGLECKPFLSMIGQGVTNPNIDVKEVLNLIQNRMKKVRVCCGDWSRVVTPSVTYKNKSLTKKGMVGVFLDPPYLVESREDKLYRVETDVFTDVCKWAIENGNNPKMRIAVCGYEGDYQFPEDWEIFHWQTGGGFSSFAKDETRGKENARRETIWFSPFCLKEG